MSIEPINRKNSVRYRAAVWIGKKKISKTFQRKIDALKWEREMRVSGRNPEPASSNENQLTLAQLMARFETDYSRIHNAFSTRKGNDSLYRNYLAEPLGSMPIKDLTSQQLQNYFVFLHRDKKTSNGRMNRVRQLLHSLFNRAVDWELLAMNPMARIKKYPCGDAFNAEGIRFLPKAEADRFLEWLRGNDPWFYPKAVVLLHTGIRYGEMSALRVADARVDAVSPHLIISRTRCRHSGEFQVPKGRRSRIIPLSPGIREFFKTLVDERTGDEPLLWKSWNEGRWTTKCSDHFLRAIRLSGVSKIRLHDLRHTYAVRFLENGGLIFVLKEILGHQDIKLTMRYSHFSPKMAEQALGIVDFEKPKTQLTVVDGGLR